MGYKLEGVEQGPPICSLWSFFSDTTEWQPWGELQGFDCSVIIDLRLATTKEKKILFIHFVRVGFPTLFSGLISQLAPIWRLIFKC